LGNAGVNGFAKSRGENCWPPRSCRELIGGWHRPNCAIPKSRHRVARVGNRELRGGAEGSPFRALLGKKISAIGGSM